MQKATNAPSSYRDSIFFPDPKEMFSEIVAIGGDLSTERLLSAYAKGIFPWYDETQTPILWWCPEMRTLLYPENFKVTKSFRRVLKNSKYRVSFDRAFDEVIELCSKVPRKGQSGSWLNEELKVSFKELHRAGYAHSAEVWIDGELIGGLYGLAIGGAFFGESMFSLKSNGSKIALKAISDVLNKRGYDFIDCQVKTSHLLSLGAVQISKESFLDSLDRALIKPIDDVGSWSNLKWEYCDGR
jgi:leucyl/phenylalanyl-tRNA--protein transferase